MRLTLSILFISFALAGCTERAAEHPPVEETLFVRLYADKLVLEEEGRLNSLDSSGIERGLDSLYGAYAVTREQARTATEYYQGDLGRWSRLQELVGKRLEELSKQASTSL